MSNFRKQISCPTSYELADAAQGAIGGELGLKIAAHLAVCEFCAAEIDVYRAFPPVDENISPPPMPAALLDLAEALFKKGTVHVSTLEHLFREAA